MTDDQNIKILDNQNISGNKDENYGLNVFENDKEINEDLDSKMFGKFEEVMLKVRNIHKYDCKSDLIFIGCYCLFIAILPVFLYGYLLYYFFTVLFLFSIFFRPVSIGTKR